MTHPPSHLRQIRYALWGLALFAAAGFLVLAAVRYGEQGAIDQTSEVPLIRADFSLIDHHGRSVTHEDFLGRWQLVFFGFTHCPDVCPTTLNRVAGVLDALGPKAEELTPLFITVDPKRDTAEEMARYIQIFDPRIVGLTGTPEAIKAAASGFRVYYSSVPQGGAPDDYTISHSTFLYLLRPDGEFDRHFLHSDPIEAIVAAIISRMEE